eukprot:7060981-Ditylum_brightwellii.AAC.1
MEGVLKGSPHDLLPVPPELTLQDVMKGFQLWNKKTSTSPLGNHLGLYKTWFVKEKKEEDDKSEDKLDSYDFFNMITKYCKWRST